MDAWFILSEGILLGLSWRDLGNARVSRQAAEMADFIQLAQSRVHCTIHQPAEKPRSHTAHDEATRLSWTPIRGRSELGPSIR